MPKGVPVATMAVNGARNAGLLAVRILAVGDPDLTARMEAFQEEIASEARGQDADVSGGASGTMVEPNLAQRLGYAADAKLVIINADDLGSCHSANVGVFECLATGTVTSATLMVPCPWAREASSRYRGEDIGVHLTLNAEYELYRWGPITHAPSLLGGDGGFPRTVEDVWDHADLDEVRRECRAQIERAILWGFDVSHLDAHMGTLQLRPEFFDVYLELAIEFGLPLRMVSPAMERYVGLSRPCRGGRGRRRLHRPLPPRPRGGLPPDLRAATCARSGPASPSSSCTRPSTAPSCARWPPTTGRPGSTTTT